MAARAVPLSRAQLPNALTIARLLALPAFVVLLLRAEDGHSLAAALLFAAAGATDQLDGWLARRWHVESRFGSVADPLADRLMIDAAVVLLVLADRLPWPALALILGRDLFLAFGFRLAVPRGYAFAVNTLGKVATWILYAALAFLMVTTPGTDGPVILFWTGVALALAAGMLYLLRAWKEVATR